MNHLSNHSMIQKTTKQPKPKLCKWMDEPCEDERVNYPGKSMLSPYCRCHLAISHIYKKRAEVEHDKAELEKVRQESKKRLTKDGFYQLTAWRHFSHYVLLHYANDDLEVYCSTNPNLRYPVRDSNICVGHYLKVFDANSTNFSTAFEFKNVAPQSRSQNENGGNMEIMAKWIEQTHGAGTVEELKQIRRQPFKLDKYTLDEISKKYLALFNEELKRRGVRNPWKN